MATLRFRFFDRHDGLPMAVIYVDNVDDLPGRAPATPEWLGAATDLAAFEEVLTRLETDLSEIRREAQLRFADHAAKRYGCYRKPRVRLLPK